MSIYSGFATRQTERKYNKLVAKLILTLELTIQDILVHTKYTLSTHTISQYSQIVAKLKSYEQHKYLEPKFSSYTEKFMTSLLSIHQLDPLLNESQQNLDPSLKNVNINILNKKQSKKPSEIYLNQQKNNDYPQPQKSQYSLQNNSDLRTRMLKASRNSNPKSISNSLHSNHYFTTEKHIKNDPAHSQKQLADKQIIISKRGNPLRIKTQQNQKSQSKPDGKSQEFRINNKIVRSPLGNNQSYEFMKKTYRNKNKFGKKEKSAVNIIQSLKSQSKDNSKKVNPIDNRNQPMEEIAIDKGNQLKEEFEDHANQNT